MPMYEDPPDPEIEWNKKIQTTDPCINYMGTSGKESIDKIVGTKGNVIGEIRGTRGSFVLTETKSDKHKYGTPSDEEWKEGWRKCEEWKKENKRKLITCPNCRCMFGA